MDAIGWVLGIIFGSPILVLLIAAAGHLIETWLKTRRPARCPHCGGRLGDGPRHEELIPDPRVRLP